MHGLPIIIRHHTVTLPASDTLCLDDLACEECGHVPDNGETIHLFAPVPGAAAIFYCDDCYRGFSTSLPAQEAK